MNKISFVRLALSALFLASLGCQSAEDRRAAELRESLRSRVNEIEPLNAQVIAEYEAYLEERMTRGREDDIARVRKSLEKAQKELPHELDDLRQRIETYPNSGLPGLVQKLNHVIESRRMVAKHVAERRAGDLEMDRMDDEWAGEGERLHELLKPKW